MKNRTIEEANEKVRRRRASFLIDVFLVSTSIGTSLSSRRRSTRVYESYLASTSNIQDVYRTGMMTDSCIASNREMLQMFN
jgi:hypothetical protein